MKLWFDEDLSPRLVQVANQHGLEATCNRDRGVLGITDLGLCELAQRGDFVLVTDNGTDFRRLLGTVELHPGLILIPGSAGLARQRQAAAQVIEWVQGAAHEANQTAADFMVNRLVQIDETGRVTASELPRPG